MRFTCLGSFSHIRHTLGARLTSFGAQLWLTLSWCWKGEKKELLALPVSFSVEKIMSPMDWEYASVLLLQPFLKRKKLFVYVLVSGRPIVEFWLSADTDTIGQKPILSADTIGRLFTNKKHEILSTFYFEAALTCTENWHAWNFLFILGFWNLIPFKRNYVQFFS